MKLPIKKIRQEKSNNGSCEGCVFDAEVSQDHFLKDQLCDLIRWKTPIDPSQYCIGNYIFVEENNETTKDTN